MRTANVTFVSHESSRPLRCGEFLGSKLTRRETVFATGEVECHVTGRCDGEFVDARETRPSRGPVDLAVVTAARKTQGWSVIAALILGVVTASVPPCAGRCPLVATVQS